MRRLLPILLAAALSAEPPRPADLGDTWTASARVRHDTGGGQDGLTIDSSSVRLEVLTRLTQIGDWRLSLSGSAGAEAHDFSPGDVAGLPPFESMREIDLGLVLSHRPPGGEGPTRFYALEVGSRTADAARLEQGLSVSFAGGSSWKLNETLTLGYLILAETRETESAVLLVVPTFRWAFSPGWTLATGRKSLVLANGSERDGELSLAIGFETEETRLESFQNKETRLLDQRLFADVGYAWTAGSWSLRAALGWELDSELHFHVDSNETEVDPGRGARLGLVGRIRL